MSLLAETAGNRPTCGYNILVMRKGGLMEGNVMPTKKSIALFFVIGICLPLCYPP